MYSPAYWACVCGSCVVPAFAAIEKWCVDGTLKEVLINLGGLVVFATGCYLLTYIETSTEG